MDPDSDSEPVDLFDALEFDAVDVSEPVDVPEPLDVILIQQQVESTPLKISKRYETWKIFSFIPPNAKGKPDRKCLPFNTKKYSSRKKGLIWNCISHVACGVSYFIDTCPAIHIDSGSEIPTFRVRINGQEHGQHASSPKYGIDVTVMSKVSNA